MLKSLSVRNYAIINSLEIDFNNGFSIITGETGAGKSILLGALSLILGQRADTSVLKNKADKCVIEGVFRVSEYNLEDFFSENEIDYDENTIIRREITDNGKSRAFINDTPVNLNLLRDLALKLVDIHSQHETLNLGDFNFQMKVVDSFSQNFELIAEYKREFNLYKLMVSEYNDLNEKARQAKADLDYFQFQFNQLDEAKLKEGEQEELENELQTLSHAEEIKRNLSKCSFLLSSEGTAILTQLKDAVNSISQIRNFFPKSLDIYDRLNSAYIELKDIASETDLLSEDVDFNPNRIESINQRLDSIYNLQQKHRVSTVKELIEIRNTLDKKLNDIVSYDQKLAELEKSITLQKTKTQQTANNISEKRLLAGPKIEKRITELLTQLGMPNAQFKVRFIKLDELTISGIDRVNFLFSANKNVEMQEISKVASGGELSRLMLSIKHILSESIALPTIIFDEIDAGISGDIANKMAVILKQMSSNMQVINITHLPQVAAKADFHYWVYKNEEKESTYTNIKLLNKDERIHEIAKMLSGENITAAALTNAKELLNI